MCQDRVYRYLKRRKNPVSAKTIARVLKIGKSSVNSNLKKMMDRGEVQKMPVPCKSNNKFKYKIIK